MDCSTPSHLLFFYQIAVLDFPRHLRVAHVPIKSHTIIRAVQTISKDGIARLVKQESLVIACKLIASLNFRVRLIPAIFGEYHNTLQLLLVALSGVSVSLVELPHSLAEFAPSNLRHVVYSFSILNCCLSFRDDIIIAYISLAVK